jgi:hypothetical protein
MLHRVTPTLLATFGAAALFGQTALTAPASDFTPPTGAVRTFRKEEGAWQKRLMTATSLDGLNFVRTGRIVTDQANVPDFVMDRNGRLYLYYTGGTVGERSNVIAVAISGDQGRSWGLRYVEIEGAGGPHPGDPDVRLLEDGSFRMFYTAGAPGSQVPEIFYAESKDGIHFTLRGSAFRLPGQVVMDSFTVPIAGRWHMYTLSETDALRHAVSENGTAFTPLDQPRFMVNGRAYIPTNEIVLPDGRVRAYAFTPGNRGDIRSWVTADGNSWDAEPGVRLSLNTEGGLEQDFVKDCAVVRLVDGTYLMAYVTIIPE